LPRRQSLCSMIALSLSAGITTPLIGQEKRQDPPPTQTPSISILKTTTRLVVVNVVAVNRKGEPVTDLKSGDITVLENGKPQQVSSFTLEQPETLQSQTAPLTPQLPPDVFTNVPRYKASRVWNVLLLDFMNSQVISQADLRLQLINISSKLPDEPLAVYVLTDKLHLLQDFGSNRADMERLLQGLKTSISARLDNAKGGHEMERYPAGFLDSLPPANREAVIRMEAQMTGAGSEARLRATVEALSKLVRNVAALPGRKNLIWVSQSFPFSIEPGQVAKGFDSATGRSFDVSVPATANALFDSEVAIYPVDPSGMHLPDDFDPAGHGTDPLGRKETNIGANSTISNLHNAETVSHSSVNDLAERTGGLAFYNLNDIGDAILRSMRDGGIYYTLTYYPTDKNWDGKFRHIMVKVNRGGIKLRFRTGYFAIDPAISGAGGLRAAQDSQFRQAMELDAPVSTALLFTAKVIPPSPSQSAMAFDFLLQPHTLTIQAGTDGLHRVSLECAVQAFNDKGERVNAAGNTMAGSLTPEAYGNVSSHGFPCRQTLELPPGKYWLRLGVRDNLSGHIGTVNAVSIVPDPAKAK